MLVGLLPQFVTCCSEAQRPVAAVRASPSNVLGNMVKRANEVVEVLVDDGLLLAFPRFSIRIGMAPDHLYFSCHPKDLSGADRRVHRTSSFSIIEWPYKSKTPN